MRRYTVFALSLLLLYVSVWLTQRAAADQLAPETPNVVLIMADDQPPDTIEYMPILQERLVAEGTTFSRAYTTTPLCCPARASLLTGLYARNHGVYTNNFYDHGGLLYFNEEYTIATALDQLSNYRTGYVGKYLNGYTAITDTFGPYVPPGWDEWYAFLDFNIQGFRFFYNYSLFENGTVVDYPATVENYSTDILTDKAVQFIETNGDDPFFLNVSYYGFHAPRIPADRHWGVYEDVELRKPPSYREEDISDKPEYVGRPRGLPDWYLQQVWTDALESLLSVDEGIGRIMDALEATGELDNTIIIYTSDNGSSWAEHRLFGKGCPYDSCSTVPMVVWYPGVTSGTVDDRFVLNIDIAPLIADVAGLDNVEFDGISLAKLADPTATWRDDFIIEFWTTSEDNYFGEPDFLPLNYIIPTYQALRNETWKYIRYETGEEELYDMVNDPYELESVASDPAYADLKATLNDRLNELLAED